MALRVVLIEELLVAVERLKDELAAGKVVIICAPRLGELARRLEEGTEGEQHDDL